MGENSMKILCVIKKLGEAPYVDHIENELGAFQELVGGYIETVTIASDLVIICNEEGRLMGIPFNVEVANVGFCGTVIAVGKKRDEFASLKAVNVPFVLKILGG